MKKTIFIIGIGLIIGHVVFFGTQQTEKTKNENSATVKEKKHPKNVHKDSFFQVTRFIMTKEEKGIYKTLPDKEARLKFQEEFWKKRDPSPGTEVNENKEEFEERLKYAIKWFNEHSKGRGWDTERGRILLQLGFPDRREFGQAEDIVRRGQPNEIGRLITSKPIPMEIWTYYNYNLVLVFSDPYEKGRLTLQRVPSQLPYALKKAKFSMDLRDQRHLKQSFKFNAEYQNQQFKITIPVKKVSFVEDNEKMSAEFNVTIYIYKDKKKIDEINKSKSLVWNQDELLNLKFIEFSIPYELSEKGKYHFDIVIEEKGSGSKFRDYASFKSEGSTHNP